MPPTDEGTLMMLEDLARAWGLSLTHYVGAKWRLSLNQPGTSMVYQYEGPDLDKVVARAWAGEDCDAAVQS